MECKRCAVIPNIDKNIRFVYIVLPTHHHVEVLEKAASVMGFHVEKKADGYLVELQDFEEWVLNITRDFYNMLEQEDIYVLPLEKPMISFEVLKQYKSLRYWRDLYLGVDLLEILSHKRIKTVFHPIVKAKDGSLYGYEALSRGVKKDGSIMSPAEMFLRAKDMDLMFYLDRLCREKVIEAGAQHGIKDKLFINFIPTSIYDPSKCLETTDAAIQKYGLNARQIVFEVVETERVDDYKHLNHILRYYQDKGYATALDDVGSGYASVGSLLELKPNYMKIDMKIIRGIHKNREQQRILQDYMGLAQENNIMVLAEGVETEGEQKYLKDNKVDFLQGYYYGKPTEIPRKL